MVRKLLCALMLTVFSGCNLCCCNFDYCGPVYDAPPPHPPEYAPPALGNISPSDKPISEVPDKGPAPEELQSAGAARRPAGSGKVRSIMRR